MNINLFKKKIENSFSNYDLELSSFPEGDFGYLERIEFDNKSKGGNVDFWEKGWIEIHVVDYLLEKEIFHILISPEERDKIEESFEFLFKILKD